MTGRAREGSFIPIKNEKEGNGRPEGDVFIVGDVCRDLPESLPNLLK